MGHLAGALRLAEVGALGKKAGASTTAIGARRVSVVEFRTVARVFVEFRKLAQRVEQVGDLRRAGRVAWLLEN